MHLPRPRAQVALLGLALLAVALIGAACAPATTSPGDTVGVDADGNFYRGDPKAPVKFVEFSDFQ